MLLRTVIPHHHHPPPPYDATPPSPPGSPYNQGFTVTLRHTPLGNTPLDEWSAQNTALYLTTHNTNKRQISMPPAGFERATPASERPETRALDRAATWSAYIISNIYIYMPLTQVKTNCDPCMLWNDRRVIIDYWKQKKLLFGPLFKMAFHMNKCVKYWY